MALTLDESGAVGMRGGDGIFFGSNSPSRVRRERTLGWEFARFFMSAIHPGPEVRLDRNGLRESPLSHTRLIFGTEKLVAATAALQNFTLVIRLKAGSGHP